MKKVLITVILITFALFAIFFSFGVFFTSNYIETQKEDLYEISQSEKFTEIDSSLITDLPIPVKKYFKYSILNDDLFPINAKVKQRAFYKTDQKSDFREFEAEQFYSINIPGFIWDAEFKIGSFLSSRAIDSYIDGKGNVQIKLLGGITISDQKNPAIDKSLLYRWLSEAVLFPTALLPGDSLKWTAIDSTAALLQLRYSGNSVSAEVNFNPNGEIEKFVTEDRAYYTRSGYRSAVNTSYYSNYKTFGNFRVPTQITIEWSFENTSFEYAKINILNVQYDQNFNE